MAAPSPTCYVKDGAGANQTTPPFDVTAGNVVTIGLVSTAGVSAWSLTLYGQDESVTPPTVTIDANTKTATFTAPALPWTLIYKSTVNGGVDANGVTQSTYSTTVGIHCKTAGGKRLLASNETTEASSTTGWLAKVNDPIRNPPAGSTPTGTGIVHITAGAQDAASYKGTAYQVLTTNAGATDTSWVTVGGDVTAASGIGSTTVVSLTGSAGTIPIASTGAIVQWAAAASSPTIAQTIAAAGSGQTLTIRPQAAASGGGGNGGVLALATGAKDGAGTDGNMTFSTGSTEAGRIVGGTTPRWQFGPNSSQATSGVINFQNGSTSTIAMRNAANSADGLTLGISVANTVQLAANSGALVLAATSNVFVEGGTINLDSSAGTTYYAITPGAALALQAKTTASTSVTYSQADNVTNSATGAPTTLQAQNATGTTAIGGALNLTSGTGTSRYGDVNVVGPMNIGLFTQAMADTNQTVSAANSKANIIVCTGALTAARTLTLTRAPTAGATVIIINQCTGGFGLNVQFASGSAFAVTSAKSAIVVGDGTNATGFTITT